MYKCILKKAVTYNSKNANKTNEIPWIKKRCQNILFLLLKKCDDFKGEF